MSQPKVIDQLRSAIRIRNYSPRTEEAYWHWIKKFILFHNKHHPSEMGEPEITAFLSHLAVERKVTASTQNQALSAVLFLYKEILKPHWSGWMTFSAPKNHHGCLSCSLMQRVQGLRFRVEGLGFRTFEPSVSD